MKDFLSEYGFAILAAIVVILLIAMCTPVGSLIKNQIMGVVDSFASKTESKLYSLDADNTLGVVIAQDGDEGKFTISATSSSDNDLLNAEYRVKDQHGNWSEWRPLGSLSTGSKEHTGSFTAKIENGNRAQVRVVDSGKADNLFYESNIVEYTGVSSQIENFEGGSSTGGGTTEVITDLTGYTWTAAEELSSIINEEYNIVYTTDEEIGPDVYQKLSYWVYSSEETDLGVEVKTFVYIPYNEPEEELPWDDVDVYYAEKGWEWAEVGWEDDIYKTIHFLSGDDVTNVNLITWLQANGTLTK